MKKAPRVLGEPVKKQTSNPEALLAPANSQKFTTANHSNQKGMTK